MMTDVTKGQVTFGGEIDTCRQRAGFGWYIGLQHRYDVETQLVNAPTRIAVISDSSEICLQDLVIRRNHNDLTILL